MGSIEMMKKFELCFEMENSRDRDYPDHFIPDLLPKGEPHTGTWDDCLRFEYRYDKVLPNSVISRFIVKAQKLIDLTDSHTYWRTGVILASDEGNFAYIKADLEDAKIFIRIKGNPYTRHNFLSIIRDKFDDIHKCPKLTPDERIVLPDNLQVTVSYKHLLKLLDRGETTYFPEEADRSYNIRELIEGIEDRRSRSKDDFREREPYSDQPPQPIVNVNIHNINQQATIMPEPEKPQPENIPKSHKVQLPSIITVSLSFVFLLSTTAFLILTFAGKLSITAFVVAMFSILLLMSIAVSFVLKATGQMEGQSFENIILAVLKQATLYDAFLSTISDIVRKFKG